MANTVRSWKGVAVAHGLLSVDSDRGDVAILRVDGVDSGSVRACGMDVQSERHSHLGNAAFDRGCFELWELLPEIGSRLVEDLGRDRWPVQVVVEGAQQNVTGQDGYEDVGVEHSDQRRGHPFGLAVEAEFFGFGDHGVERLPTLGDHLVAIGDEILERDPSMGAC